MTKFQKFLIALTLPGLMATAPAQAAYPDKPIKIVAPYSAGGSSDLLARAVSDQLAAELRQPVIVENRPGAGSMIGTTYVAGEAADGYTLLLVDVPFTIVPALYGDRVKYDARKDFTPVSLLGISPMYLFVSPASPAQNLKGLLAAAKDKPGTITIGSGGNGSLTHLMAELFMMNTETKLVHVPYKSAGASVSDLAGGQIQTSFSSMPSASAMFQAGKIKPIAVSSPERQPSTPDVPTFKESGFPGINMQSWWGLVAPAGTPQAALDTLRTAMVKVMQTAPVKQRLATLGLSVPANTDADALQEYMTADFARWQDVIKRANITIQ